jgi:hypothetical protein
MTQKAQHATAVLCQQKAAQCNINSSNAVQHQSGPTGRWGAKEYILYISSAIGYSSGVTISKCLAERKALSVSTNNYEKTKDVCCSNIIQPFIL